MTACGKKSLGLTADPSATITARIDILGNGRWVDCQTFPVKPGTTTNHYFPSAFSAYLIRFFSDSSAIVSAQLAYQ